MSTDKMDSSAVYALFEEIRQGQKEAREKSERKVQDTASTPDLSGIENCVNQSNERLLSKLEDFRSTIAHPEAQKIHHRISIEIKSSWVFLTIIGLALFLITSLTLNYKQKQANGRLNDNDLKYRYVKMQGEANDKVLLKLETDFTYNRNQDSISIVRQRVEQFERLVREQIEKAEQAKFNTGEAERLQKEVEMLKNR